MLNPIRYEIPLFLPDKSKLKEYDEYLYKVDKLIEEEQNVIEESMKEEILKNWWTKRILLWRKWYWLIFRFKVLLINHTYNLTFRDTEKMIKNNISVRLFLDIMWEEKIKIPKYSTIQWWNQEFGESFIKKMNEKFLIPIAKKKKILKWRKSRTDTTVVEENISYPTDSTLLKKWKDLLIRWIGKIDEILSNGNKFTKTWVKKGIRRVKKIYYDIKKYARKRWEEAKEEIKNKYEELTNILSSTIKITENTIKEVKQKTKRKWFKIKVALKWAISELETTLCKVWKVVTQTRKRVLEWKTVQMKDKLISYFSDRATIIKKWKEGKSVEIGRKLSVTEWESGIVTNWQVLEWNPNDSTLLRDTLEDIKKSTWKNPKNNSFDRWYRNNKEIEILEKEYNVKLHIPKQWKKSKADIKREKTWVFKTHQRFRSWWEWKISILKRRAWLRKLRVRWKSVETKIWWWIFSDNMKIIA